MTPKRGDRVAPPGASEEFEVRFATSAAAKGWEDLCNQAATNTLAAWRTMRTDPLPAIQTKRHSRLKFDLATAKHNGKEMPQWQIEVTNGARVWYLVDEGSKTCWVKHAGTGHPKATDK